MKTSGRSKQVMASMFIALMPFISSCSEAAASDPKPTSSATTDAASETPSAPAATRSSSPSSQASSTARTNDGTGFWLEYIREKAVTRTILGQSDGELLSSAKGMCERMKRGELFEEVSYSLVTLGLPKPYQADMTLIFGSGTAAFCPEFLVQTGGGDDAILERLRTVAPGIAHNPDATILAQARSACPSATAGPAQAAATVHEARRVWGNEQGYKFIFISVLNYCSSGLNNIISNK